MSATEGKVITCKAAVSWNANEPLSIETVQVAPPKAGEVRVKIVASGICFSDLSAMRGKILNVQFPMIVGHEASGVVESIGEGVTSLQVGDHVITLFLPHCKKCTICVREDANTCLELMGTQMKGVLDDGTSRFTCKGQQILQLLGCSTFSEYTVMKECSLTKINPKAPLDVVCILSCGFPTGYGAPMKTVKVQPGSTCVVFGLGTIGLAALFGCKQAGATTIIGIDLNPEKFKIAKELGGTDFINPKDLTEPIEDYLKRKFNFIDYAFEAIGNINTIQQAFNVVAIGYGTCVLIGVPPQEQQMKIFPIEFLFGKKLTGEFFGSYKGRDDIPKLVEDYMDGHLPLEKFITHNITLDEINRGFELLINGESLRCVVKMS